MCRLSNQIHPKELLLLYGNIDNHTAYLTCHNHNIHRNCQLVNQNHTFLIMPFFGTRRHRGYGARDRAIVTEERRQPRSGWAFRSPRRDRNRVAGGYRAYPLRDRSDPLAR